MTEEKLKTLKDLEIEDKISYRGAWNLKQEAIRIIKKLKECGITGNESYSEFVKMGIKFDCEDHGGDYCLNPDGVIIVIKVLYNITEEDLKQGD